MSSYALRLLVDAQNCPVKAEIYRIAARYGLQVLLVRGRDIGTPFEPWLTKVIAGDGQVAATICNEAHERDLVITDNAELAQTLIEKKIRALTTLGQRWTAEGARPLLQPNSRASSKSRFLTVLEDEVRLAMGLKV